MNKLACLLACLLTLSLAACDSGGGSSDAPTCEGLATHTIALLKTQGDDAMLKEKDIPMITAACTKNELLGKNKEDVACVMKAKDLEGLKACEGFDAMMKGALK